MQGRQHSACEMRAALLVCVVLAGCGRVGDDLPYYITPELTPQFLSGDVAESPDIHRVGHFALVRSDGLQVDQLALDGKVSIVHFFFTECNGVCPKTQPNLAWLLKQFPGERRIQILSHSVKPSADSVRALEAYAAMHRITDTRWILLTGAMPEIEKVARQYYYANLNDGRSYGVTDLAHTETLYLVDGERRIRGVYNGTLRLDVERLREDAAKLIH
jgi:protein SCO1